MPLACSMSARRSTNSLMSSYVSCSRRQRVSSHCSTLIAKLLCRGLGQLFVSIAGGRRRQPQERKIFRHVTLGQERRSTQPQRVGRGRLFTPKWLARRFPHLRHL